MSNIVPFEFEGVPVRVVDQNGDPWWVLADVCFVLEHTDPSKMASRLDPDEKGTTIVRTLGGDQEMLIISEPGLYKLIQTSRKPASKRFDRWVRHEVLVSLRKTGRFVIPGAEQQPVSIELFKKTWELIGVQFTTQGAAIQRVENKVDTCAAEVVRLRDTVTELAPRRRFFPKKTQDQYSATCEQKFGGKCCCGCGRMIMKPDPQCGLGGIVLLIPDDEVYRIDHLNGRHRTWPRDGLPVHDICNRKFENDPDLRERLKHRAAIFHEEREKLFPEKKLA
jgi:prophage antirepressor-like protein